MSSTSPLLSFLILMVSGWVYHHQLIVIEFLQAENRLLQQRLRGRRIRFTDAERALLARKAKAVGRKTLVVRNNSRRGCCRVQRLQTRAESGMMNTCCSWRERSSE